MITICDTTGSLKDTNLPQEFILVDTKDEADILITPFRDTPGTLRPVLYSDKDQKFPVELYYFDGHYLRLCQTNEYGGYLIYTPDICEAVYKVLEVMKLSVNREYVPI